MTPWGHAANLGWKGITWKLTQRVTRVSVGFNYSKSHLCETWSVGKWNCDIYFFLFIWNPASSLTTIRTETSARDSIRFVFRSQIAIDRFFTKQILYRLTYDSNYIRSKYKNHIYIYISCIYTYTHKIEFNFVINRVRLHDRFHEIFAPFPRRSLRIDREKRSRPRFKIRQNSWCWILDWRRREDPTTTARFSVFLAWLSAENTDEFRSRNTPGLAPCGQTSKGLGTLGRRWIEARLLGCRLASARRSSLRIAGQPTASSTIGLQPPSG